MAEFLIEIYSEEIPAKMQNRAVADFKSLFGEFLLKNHITYQHDKINTYITPTRLVLHAANLPAEQIIPGSKRTGPRVGADSKAIEGFLRSVGANDVAQLTIIENKNGDCYAFEQKEQHLQIRQILAENLPVLLQKMSGLWPKSMRWLSGKNANITWVRPIRNILAIFDGEIIAFNFANLTANNQSFGHKSLYRQPFVVKNFSEYQQKLQDSSIVLDQVRRKEIILSNIKKICAELNCVTIENLDEGRALLDEVVGLVENPQILLGKIDNEFMALPEEVLILTVKLHQKYFCLRDLKGKLAPYFIFISNIPVIDSSRIIADNEKVVRARLSDAKFFITEDLKIPLRDRVENLKEIVFHKKLGSLYQKVRRLETMNKFIALWVPNADLTDAEDLADLEKNDLITKAVAELPELQGIIGKYYAQSQGYKSDISLAIAEQYLPSGKNSELPQSPLGVVLSLADKIDTIVGLFLAGEKPSSSKDPYALRRAALGVIRIIIQHNLTVPLRIVIEKSVSSFSGKSSILNVDKNNAETTKSREEIVLEILNFFLERYKVLLKETHQINPEIVNEIFEEKTVRLTQDKKCDLLTLLHKAVFVNNLVSDPEKIRVLGLYKRVANILAIEEKNDSTLYNSRPSFILLQDKNEKLLHKKLKSISANVKKLIKHRNYQEAMELLTELEEPLNKFFDNVLVNDHNKILRHNRLLLLSAVRELFELIFNFSKIEIGAEK